MAKSDRNWTVLIPLDDTVPNLMVMESRYCLIFYAQKRLEFLTGEEMTWELLTPLVQELEMELEYIIRRYAHGNTGP